jgi:4-hydroxybenzoate polyprenyltransferase
MRQKADSYPKFYAWNIAKSNLFFCGSRVGKDNESYRKLQKLYTSHMLPTKPIYVDLEGVLIRTNLLLESIFVLVKKNPLSVFPILYWLLKGRIKEEVAQRTELEITLLPYNEKLLEYLKSEAKNERRLILISNTAEKFTQKIATHLGIFQEIITANPDSDLTSYERLNPLPFQEKRNNILIFLKAIRFHQWIKNFLIFIPIFAAHKYFDWQKLLHAALAFISISLCASAIYVINDLLDLEVDRKHQDKKNRPFASGSFSIAFGLIISPLFLGAAFGLSLATLPDSFSLILLLYLFSTILYSLWLKSKIVVDVLILAGLYTLRIFAGSQATGVHASFWMLAFSAFIFLSLAFVKRAVDLHSLVNSDDQDIKGRGYLVSDLGLVQMMGIGSGYLSVLVILFYLHDKNTALIYSNPQILWLLGPILLFWINRIWLLSSRGVIHSDPIIFAIKDKTSWITAILLGSVVLISK